MTEVCTDSCPERMIFRFLSFRPLRFCHSERSEESWYYAQGRLREKSFSFCKDRLATNLRGQLRSKTRRRTRNSPIFLLFMSLTEGLESPALQRVIYQSVVTAAVVGVSFLVVGKAILELLGITVGDFMIEDRQPASCCDCCHDGAQGRRVIYPWSSVRLEIVFWLTHSAFHHESQDKRKLASPD